MTDKAMVALDLDDLIFPFIETAVPFLNRALNTSVAVDDVLSMNFEDIWGSTQTDSVALMEELISQLDATPEPIEGSIEAIAKLSEQFELSIITSRTDAMRDKTLDWLETHFSGTFLEVHLTNNWVTDGRPTKRRKADVCLELNAIALVDDNYSHVQEAAVAGIKGILFGDFAWNRNYRVPEGVTRAQDWNQVTDQLLAMR